MADPASPQTPRAFPAPPRVAVVVSRYNIEITEALCAGALAEYRRWFSTDAPVETFWAPGSFEVPLLADHAARDGRYQAVVALGCVIRGETTHDQHINSAVSNQIMRSACETGVPIGFGILTVETPEQARARAGGPKGNKGAEAMSAALDVAATLASLRTRSF